METIQNKKKSEILFERETHLRGIANSFEAIIKDEWITSITVSYSNMSTAIFLDKEDDKDLEEVIKILVKKATEKADKINKEGLIEKAKEAKK